MYDELELARLFHVHLETPVGGKSRAELLAELMGIRCLVTPLAIRLMSKPEWVPGEIKKIQFARVPVHVLGFTEDPTITMLWARIVELGYFLCEPADAPAIRLALPHQHKKDSFLIVMRPISDGKDVFVFRIRRDPDGRLVLGTSSANPEDKWPLENKVMFRLRN
jgi:hypothetical protein